MAPVVARLLERFATAVHPLYSRLFTRVTLLEGEPAHGGPPMRCLFVGSTDFLRYLGQRVFAAPPAVRGRSRERIARARRTLAEVAANEIDLCVADLPVAPAARFARGADFLTDPMVFQYIDVHGEWFLARTTPRRMRKRIEAAGLSCSVSTDAADLRFFYERMYRPHAVAQYGGLASLSPLAELEKRLRDGWLVFVSAAGQRIAGALVTAADETATGYKIGVLDGDRRHVEADAVSAIYLFTIDAVRERGWRRLELESSRPVLNDGAFVHKKTWGAGVRRDERPLSTVSFFFRGRSKEFAARFLARHPLVVTGPGGLWAAVGAGPSGERPADDKTLRDLHYCPGLVGLTAVSGHIEDARAVRF
jgi:hypothetical protein